MITAKELKNKCLKYWNGQAIQRSVLSSDSLFPLTFLKIRLPARELSEEFGSIREALHILHAQSKEQKGFGYTLCYRTIQHRQLGRQKVPETVVFETHADFLKFSGLSEEYRIFCDLLQMMLDTIPSLADWLLMNTAKILEYRAVWDKLLAVVLFLQENPKPNCYLRELPIPGIDSKFIEQNKGILREILDILLAPEQLDAQIQGFQNHGFERRYGFKYPEPLIRFRILDTTFAQQFLDVSVPLSEFRKLDLRCNQVIVTENKVNGLSFPNASDAIIIFGLGYGIQSLANIPWLQEMDIYYWGDLDTHGFAILSQFRSYYPQAKSLFMDELTLKNFITMAVEESQDKRMIATLAHLTEQEQCLYQALCKNTYGTNIRIEQERLDFKYIRQRLQQIFIL
jgi:hypothetical protein